MSDWYANNNETEPWEGCYERELARNRERERRGLPIKSTPDQALAAALESTAKMIEVAVRRREIEIETALLAEIDDLDMPFRTYAYLTAAIDRVFPKR